MKYCHLISLGKGFVFHVLLDSAKEKASIWARGSMNIKPGIVGLQEWSLDFNPVLQNPPILKCGYVLYIGLNWALWHPKILADIATAWASRYSLILPILMEILATTLEVWLRLM